MIVTGWQPPRFSHEQRLSVAQTLTARLRERYRERLVAVAVEGSTAKGLDRPESDLELHVILEGAAQRWYPFFFCGMFVGISYRSPEEEVARAQQVDYEWPVTSDALFTARVLYDPTGLYDRLRALARDAEREADFRALVREALADLYEQVLKVFTLRDGEALAASVATARVAYWSAVAVALHHRHRYLSSRTMYEESFTLPDLPAGYEAAVRALLARPADLAAARAAVGGLWLAFREWAKGRGVTLDDDALAGL